MAAHNYTIEVQADFIERQAKARPVQAVAELIWNGLDADATRVDVRLEYGALGMTKVIVSDNGYGIPFADVPKLFTRLGGSWKAPGGHTKTKQRMLHGYEGRGRFKGLCSGAGGGLARDLSDRRGDVRAYEISMLEDNIREVRVTDEEDIRGGKPGVEVSVSELHRDFRSLAPDVAVQELAETLALYWKDYRDVSVFYEGQHVDPAAVIAAARTVMLTDIDEATHPVELRDRRVANGYHTGAVSMQSRGSRYRRFRHAFMSASSIFPPI